PRSRAEIRPWSLAHNGHSGNRRCCVVASGSDELCICECREAGQSATQWTEHRARSHEFRSSLSIKPKPGEKLVGPGARFDVDQSRVCGVGVLRDSWCAESVKHILRQVYPGGRCRDSSELVRIELIDRIDRLDLCACHGIEFHLRNQLVDGLHCCFCAGIPVAE